MAAHSFSSSCRRLAWLAPIAFASGACVLDFALGDRQFECPPSVADCEVCAPDGSCRVPKAVAANQPTPGPGVPAAAPGNGEGTPPLGRVSPDPKMPAAADASAPPDAGPPAPCSTVSPLGTPVCLSADGPCLELGPELQSALVVWLDPTSLPAQTSPSGHWCDRSGNGNHAQHVPASESLRIARDPERPSSAELSRSLELGGNWMLLPSDSLVFGREDFAVLVAAAVPLDANDEGNTDLFESDNPYQISLTVHSPAYAGLADARVKLSAVGSASGTDMTVQTLSSVYDRRFHLYTLQRLRSTVLQLRLNGVLEARTSRAGVPADLNLASSGLVQSITGIGGNDLNETSSSTARGRVAAVVILKGKVDEGNLSRLEQFLCSALQVCAPPEPLVAVEAGVPDASATGP